ncbi:MAG: hypothetical protein GY929_02740 [Actinomycetia bacterium]|nr:hypothetical protein [Actinomycetes bacterium]
MSRRRPNKNLAPGQPPQPLRWKPRFRALGMVSGLFGGLGAVLLVQQYGVAPLSRALTLQGLIGGLLSGVIVPSAVFVVVVWFHNRRLARALGPNTAAPPGAPTVMMILVLAGGLALVSPFLAQRPAGAEVSGPCGGQIDGVDLATVDASAADAFEFNEGETVRGYLFVDAAIIGLRAGMTMMGRDIVVVDAPPDPSDPGEPGDASFEVAYEDISWLGAGLIEFWADADVAGGGSCEIRFMVNIDGNPLDTVVGKAAAGAVAVGVVGMSISGIGAVMEGGRAMGDLRRGLTQVAHSDGLTGGGGSSVVPVGDFAPPSMGGADSLVEAGAGGDLTLDYQTVTVSEGDNLWSLSEARLEADLGRPATDGEIADYWRQVVDANQSTLQSGDPDLIYPGESITLPDPGLDTAGAPLDGPVVDSSAAAPAGAVPEGGATDWWQDPGEVDTGGADATAPTDGGGPPPGGTDTAAGSGDGGSSEWWDGDATGGETDPPGVGPPDPEPPLPAADVPSLTGTEIGAASASLGVAAVLVPARHLLLTRFAMGSPDELDERVEQAVRDTLDRLDIDHGLGETLIASGLDQATDDRLTSLADQLTDDGYPPTVRVEGPAGPPRVAAVMAWLALPSQPEHAVHGVRAALVTAPYLDDLMAGQGRPLDRIERKAVWPWTHG